MKMNLASMIGQKIFIENDDESISILRIKSVNKDQTEITTIDCADNEEKVIKGKEEINKYTPLIPDGICMFNIVKMIGESEEDIHYDIMVTGNRMLSIQLKDPVPYCICRQSALDIFSKMYFPEKKDYYGISISQDSCPKGINFPEYLTCDEVIYSRMVNFYRNDTIDDILKFVDQEPYNDMLKAIFKIHIATERDPKLSFVSYHRGYCKTLEKLLHDNNFQADLDSMLGILSVDFNLKDYIIEKKLPNMEETYDSITDELKSWLSSIYKLPLNNVTVIKYGHDINLSEFNSTRYTFIRDNNNDLYLVVYTLDGENHIEDYKEQELNNSPFKVHLYNKYSKK